MRTILDNDWVFSFFNTACECVIDTIHPQKGETEYVLHLYPNKAEKLRFAYDRKKWLFRIDKSKSISKKSILTELLAIKIDNIEEIKRFIENFGFLLPIEDGNEYSIKASDVIELINRVRAAVFLISEVSKEDKDYLRLLGFIMYLQMSPPVKITFPNFKFPFETCIHKMTELMEHSCPIMIPREYPIHEELGDERVMDAIKNEHVLLELDDVYFYINLEDEIPEYKGKKEVLKSKVTEEIEYLYYNAVNLPVNTRKLIDFLYHFRKVSEIRSWNYKGELELIETGDVVNKRLKTFLADEFKKVLIDIAKDTIKNELDFNLRFITADYDTESMLPSWKIKSLLSGLYFSIFFMRPDVEIYRACANPDCIYSFLVSTTASKKKYCSQLCGNAMAQKRYRAKTKNSDDTK